MFVQLMGQSYGGAQPTGVVLSQHTLSLLTSHFLADMPFLSPAAGLQPSGVLTPASALGMLLVDRLRRAGFKFDITGGTSS